MRAAILVVLAAPLTGCALYDGLTGGGCDATPTFVSVNQTIPDNNFTGISSSVNSGFGTVNGITVSIDTYHPYPGELNYSLAHNGVYVTLDGNGDHDISDFDGYDASGTWTMTVYDDTAVDEGTWYSWEIAICVD